VSERRFAAISVSNRNEQRTAEVCPSCRRIGDVLVVAFRWAGKRHLSWYCRSCGHAWARPERRALDRF
jgi:transposase-like protein